MHMADALISPAVGAAMWTAAGATTVYCAKKVREDPDQSKIPLMGVTGAFIFASQMLNFTIPGTGSSGHLGGGLILAILLGPEAAFLVMASVLTVQALFFADGGLLALGCNIFNLGFFPAFVAFPLIYRKIVRDDPTPRRIVAGSILGAAVGLQLGALGVVAETALSGISELPFGTFVVMMLPIHLAIGLVEGLATAAVILFVRQARPEILGRVAASKPLRGVDIRPVLIGLTIAAVLAGAAFSWFASANPDGLEWSIAKVTGKEEVEGISATVHRTLASIQEKTAFLPDYAFPTAEPPASGETAEDAPSWPAVDAGTSTAGLVGAAITLLVAVGAGFVLQRRSAKRLASEHGGETDRD